MLMVSMAQLDLDVIDISHVLDCDVMLQSFMVLIGHRAVHVLNNSCLVLRLRKVWQKRKCSVKNGFLTICHGTVRRHILLSYWSTCMRSSALLPACPSANKKGFVFDFSGGNR